MSRTFFGTYVSHTADALMLRDVNGSEQTFQLSRGADLSEVTAARDTSDVTAYVLTDAGRVRHVDTLATLAFRRLRETFPRGAEVHTILTHVSTSGMSRHIAVLAPDERGGIIRNVSPDAARVLGWKFDRDAYTAAVTVSGAGMDMGFHLVYSLSRALHGDGYALSHRWL